MKYIYCPSYNSFRLVFYFMSQKKDVTIITYNRDLCLIAEEIGIPVIFLDVEKIKIPRVRQLLNPFNLIKFRIEMYRLFLKSSKNIKNGEFYFTINCIDLPGLHLISLFIKYRNDLNINYWQEYKNKVSVKVECLLTPFKFIELIYINMLYKPYFYYGKVAEGYFYIATKSFLRNKNLNIVEIDEIWSCEIYRNIGSELSEKYAKSVILLGSYSLEMDYKIYKKNSLMEVYDILKHHCPDIYFKQHPGPTKPDKYFSGWRIVPKHVPSEIICQKAKLVIGTATVGMCVLAKLGVTCISVLELLDPQPDFDKAAWISRMTNDSNGKIIFVKSKHELIKYLDQITKKPVPINGVF